jgi:translocator protein
MTTRILASITFLITLIVNALANALPINNLTTGEVADLYPSLFTPAGITFSIWSVIYLSLVIFLFFAWSHRRDSLINQVLPYFILSNILNASWIMAWHYLLPFLSVMIMLGLLTTLTAAFLKINSSDPDSQHRWMVSVPFTLYLSWICVATIANIAAYLSSSGWNALNIEPAWWTIVMLSVATALASWILIRYKTVVMPLVVLWTLVGIFLRWQNTDYRMITSAAVILAAILVIVVVSSITKRKAI